MKLNLTLKNKMSFQTKLTKVECKNSVPIMKASKSIDSLWCWSQKRIKIRLKKLNSAKGHTVIIVLLLYAFAIVKRAEGLSLFPDFFHYKTCADAPPTFSEGCMENATVNLGDRVTFNCQVRPIES